MRSLCLTEPKVRKTAQGRLRLGGGEKFTRQPCVLWAPLSTPCIRGIRDGSTGDTRMAQNVQGRRTPPPPADICMAQVCRAGVLPPHAKTHHAPPQGLRCCGAAACAPEPAHEHTNQYILCAPPALASSHTAVDHSLCSTRNWLRGFSKLVLTHLASGVGCGGQHPTEHPVPGLIPPCLGCSCGGQFAPRSCCICSICSTQ